VLLLSNIPTNQRRKKQQMNNFRKIKKNAKALSPVVASIILIAVTVAVSVVVAAWMGGMTTGLMGSAEQASITNIAFDDTTSGSNAIIVTVQNTGDNAITFKSAFINGIEVTALPTEATTPIVRGTSQTFNLDMPTGLGDLVAGTLYQVKLMTGKGNPVVNSETYANPN
jgi:archaeal type IV pilus assembly protein PilA